MRREIATGAVLLGLTTPTLASCGEPSEPMYVGDTTWVKVISPIDQYYRRSKKSLKPGDECLIEREERLEISGPFAIYNSKESGGTECPDGAEIDLTPEEVRQQNDKFIAFDTRRKQVTSEIRRMNYDTSSIAKSIENGGWVDVVNPDPVKHPHWSRPTEYGDRCHTMSSVGESKPRVKHIGNLSTGEKVLRVDNPDAGGTRCQSGILYLEKQVNTETPAPIAAR